MSDAPITPEVVAPVAEAPVHTEAPADPDWLPARLERAKKSATSELLASLGVSSIEEVKTVAQKVQEFDAIKAAQMTELERVAAERDAFKTQLTEVEARAAAAEVKALRTSIGSAKGIPAALIDMLTGTDEESITAQVAAILAAMPNAPLPAAVHDVATDPDAGKTPEERALIAAFRKST